MHLVVFESVILLFLEELTFDYKERFTDRGTYIEVFINGFNSITTASLPDDSFMLSYILGDVTAFS